jgi:hypothetical protein
MGAKMLAGSTRSTLPLSPAVLAVRGLRVPTHPAGIPAALSDLACDRPRFAWHRLSGLDGLAGEDVLPSMPSPAAAAATRPVALRPSPVPREPSGEAAAGPAGRRSYTDASFPWRCVCRVASGTRSGSGVLIGPRHVLTAADAIDWDVRTASVSFPRGGLCFAAAAATDAVTVGAADDRTGGVVIVLNQRLGDCLGFLGARSYDGDWDGETDDWCNIAYAPDMAGATLPAFQTGFFLEGGEAGSDGGRLLRPQGAAFGPGMSGSPVLGFWDEGPFVVGVAGGDGMVTVGAELTGLVREARVRFA